MNLFPAVKNSAEDRVALAVRDLLDTDELMRGVFSGSADEPSLDPTGTVDIAPGSKDMVGTGSNWLTTLRSGFKVLVVDQVGIIDSVASDTSANLRVAHADGAISGNGDRVLRGARSERVNATDMPLQLAPPYYTVGLGAVPDAEPGIGRLKINPSVQITYVFPRQQQVLRDDEASWGGLNGQVRNILAPAKGVNDNAHRLCVPRFGNEALVFRLSGFAAGSAPLVLDGDGTIIMTPAVVVTYEGMDPKTVEQIPQRW